MRLIAGCASDELATSMAAGLGIAPDGGDLERFAPVAIASTHSLLVGPAIARREPLTSFGTLVSAVGARRSGRV